MNPKPIHDPDLPTRGVDVEYDTERRVIYIRPGGAIDELAGITGQCLYNFTRYEWPCAPEGFEDLCRYDFPFNVNGAVDGIIGLEMNGGWTIDPYGLSLLRRTFLRAEGAYVLDPYFYVSVDMREIKFYE